MKIQNQAFLFTILLGLTLSSCSVFKKSGSSSKNAEKDTLVVIGTNLGEITVLLYAQTPQHRKNFLKLAGEHFYDSTTFHRIIQGFMVQGGDPNSKDTNPGNDGQGGPGYTVPAEFNPAFTHVQGAIAAARMGDQVNPEKRSSGSQFYLVENTSGTHQLDQGYTVFGLSLKGIDVIQKIAKQPKAPGDRPLKDIKMWVKLLPVKKAMVTSMYGFDYLTSTIKPELIIKK